MSINGIDSQIMVTRTTDFSRDTSVQQKRNETAQDYLAIQTKAMDVQDQQKVAKTPEAENARMHTEADGRSGSESEQKRRASGGEEKDEEPVPGTVVPPENHIIDIKV